MAEHATREEEKAERERSFFAPSWTGPSFQSIRSRLRAGARRSRTSFAHTTTMVRWPSNWSNSAISDLAKLTSGLSKSGGGVGFLWTSDPTSEIFQNKLGKTYLSDRRRRVANLHRRNARDARRSHPDQAARFDFHAWAGTVSPRMVHGRKGLPGDCGLTRSPHSLRALRSTRRPARLSVRRLPEARELNGCHDRRQATFERVENRRGEAEKGEMITRFKAQTAKTNDAQCQVFFAVDL